MAHSNTAVLLDKETQAKMKKRKAKQVAEQSVSNNFNLSPRQMDELKCFLLNKPKVT